MLREPKAYGSRTPTNLLLGFRVEGLGFLGQHIIVIIIRIIIMIPIKIITNA